MRSTDQTCTGWPQSHAPMLIKKVIVVTFIQIQSSLQGLQMLDMYKPHQTIILGPLCLLLSNNINKNKY